MKRPHNATCPMANRASRDGDGARLVDEGHLFLAPVKVGGWRHEGSAAGDVLGNSDRPVGAG
jgi:hypothetical protein